MSLVDSRSPSASVRWEVLKAEGASKELWPLTPTTVPTISTVDDVHWDYVLEGVRSENVIDALMRESCQINRAYICIGNALAMNVERLRRTGSSENDVDYVPDRWSIQVGNIETGRDGEYIVGDLAVCLDGNGYPYPWTLKELLSRAHTYAWAASLMVACKEIWPVAEQEPSREIVEMRRQMGPYWPYDDVTRPVDWAWGFQGLL